MNAPNRYELYTLGEGELKLTIDEDTKIPNACTLTINKEDHTLANMLRAQLLQLPYVIFSGYKVPHPLEPKFIIKVQTDGSSTPIQAIQESVKSLILILGKMRVSFQNEFRLAKAVGLSDDQNDNDLVGGVGLGGGGLNGRFNDGLAGQHASSINGMGYSGYGSSAGYGNNNQTGSGW
ncbi:DNA-directed RNA polymerase [Phakopsora pachyrhizi]|uniref:DNA-directed RNA polymerase n=1 Tax=Phakopsora pachyrhizi TaxID=170000 RepID=A0AAV0B4X6_PHAPC|nr:DNA-directed RNA polymerase [Phakopsora pachyrhizi]CAH7681024.1 DNA-directed RNA polymerase [Phakopsora pachyrhizi]